MTTRARVVAAHRAPDRAPIQVHRGMRVRLGERDGDWTDFVWTVLADGNGGWVPQQLFDVVDAGIGVAREDYDTTELDADPGDELAIGPALAQWHWARDTLGREGWIPARNIEPIEGQ